MPYIYAFDHKHRKSPMSLKDLLGGKGANLAEMMSVLKLPVPHGFTVTTDACRDYMHSGWPKGLDKELATHFADLSGVSLVAEIDAYCVSHHFEVLQRVRS